MLRYQNRQPYHNGNTSAHRRGDRIALVVDQVPGELVDIRSGLSVTLASILFELDVLCEHAAVGSRGYVQPF